MSTAEIADSQNYGQKKNGLLLYATRFYGNMLWRKKMTDPGKAG